MFADISGQMRIQEQISLKPYNTFGIEAKAKKMVIVESLEELKQYLQEAHSLSEKILVLGGGSNILFCSDFDGTVLKIESKSFAILSEDENSVIIESEAGVEWDDLVQWTVKKGLGGLENLSLIPGTVGAAPVQNIGAYGAEVKDTVEEVDAIHRFSLEQRTFSRSDCQFDYRYSVFKESENPWIITKVRFRLQKNPLLNLSYSGLKQELQAMGIRKPDCNDVRNAVCEIRRSKLPDPKETGNAGSFFKNPVINASHFDNLITRYPNMAFYRLENDLYKIAAGWLIEKAGWKGYREGDCGVHPKQALVLVNYGNATGKDILILSQKIQDSVKQQFGINLHPEVTLIR